MAANDRARKVVIASFLGWMLDAFDFFIMVFVFSDVAKEFGVSITAVTVAVTLTLAMRALGAYIFGATFPGVVYQLGNLLASYNATLQAGIGASMEHNYNWALAGVVGVVAVVIAALVGFGVEAHDVKMGEDAALDVV